MNIETDAIDALGASLDIADDVLGVYEELGKIPKTNWTTEPKALIIKLIKETKKLIILTPNLLLNL